LNTGEVAKLLGVSKTTIKRWVKRMNLPLERNERGHYQFDEEAVEQLKFIQNQVNNGVFLHEISATSEKTIRKGTVKQQVDKDRVDSEKTIRKGTVKQQIDKDSVDSEKTIRKGTIKQQIDKDSVDSEKTIRIGTVKQQIDKDPAVEELAEKVASLEKKMEKKADSVASYQLLQHRREIDELQKLVKALSAKVEELTAEVNELKKKEKPELSLAVDNSKNHQPMKKKKLFSNLFSF
jgi:chromosome-anchoring protein RacA